MKIQYPSKADKNDDIKLLMPRPKIYINIYKKHKILTSNFCRSSSLPSSPSGCTGTLKYSPSSWDRSLNLETGGERIRHGKGGKKHNMEVQKVPHHPSYHPSTACFWSSEMPKEREPMKSFLLVRSQSQISTDSRRSLSASFNLLRCGLKGKSKAACQGKRVNRNTTTIV